ncbi:MAG: hypothetical protein LBI66_07920 [Burkholderiaceae bacterium]|jgi:hypothetical protein|nr:hypothetical protein [Burkholderiaceae bacterium]
MSINSTVINGAVVNGAGGDAAGGTRSIRPVHMGRLSITVGVAVEVLVCLKDDVLIREDDDVVAEDNQGVTKLFGGTLTVFESLICENVGLRPETQKGLATKLAEDALGLVYSLGAGQVEHGLCRACIFGSWCGFGHHLRECRYIARFESYR